MTALPDPGSRFGGKYVIERQLGRGAVGVVYAATHEELRRRVAIKLLREADPVASERMIREARAALALQSEHIVRVMDVGRHEGHVFLVMEHLEGDDLASILRDRGPLPVPEAVDCILHACSGLVEAHARGIVHRDLKPSNLFLTRRADGSPLVKVLDFGISKSSDVEDIEGSLTGPAELLGSPTYMSPEQVRGAKGVDHRSDIWSLGVILFRLISGRLPFGRDAKTVSATLASVLCDPPPSLRELQPAVPRELETIVMRCLEKQAGERPSSAAELAAQLAPFGTEDGRAAVARLVGGVSAPPARRRLPLLVAAACGLLAISAATLLVVRHGKQTATTPDPPPVTAAVSDVSNATDAGGALASAASASASPSGFGVAPAAAWSSRPAAPVVRHRRPAGSSVVRSAATDDRY